MIDLIALCIATWRITSILNKETAGFPFRKLLGEKIVNPGLVLVPDTFLGELYHCFWCLSVWVSTFCFIVYLVEPLFLYPFAISGIVIFIESKVINNGKSQHTNANSAGTSSSASTD